MFYKHNYRLPKTTKKTIKPSSDEYICYNAKIKDKYFQNFLGVGDVVLPSRVEGIERTIPAFDETGVKKIWFFNCFDENNQERINRVMYLTGGGNICEFTLVGLAPFSTCIEDVGTFENQPIAYEYRKDGVDYMLFSGDDRLSAYAVNKGVTNQTKQPFLAMETCYDLLFGIVEADGNNLSYSENLNPFEWTASENVEFLGSRGVITKLVNYNDYLYIFREYGISQLTKFTSSGQFGINNLFVSGAKIYKDTIVNCGDEIMFFARDGMYVFNGSTAKKLDLNINKFFENISNENACATFLDGKYYLACKMNFGDDIELGCETLDAYKNNALVCYNTLTGEVEIARGLDIACILGVEDGNINRILVGFNGEYQSYFGMLNQLNTFQNEDITSYCILKETDFGIPNKLKNLTKISIKTQKNCEILIKSDIETKKITISGSNLVQKIKPLVRGEKFEISIISQGGFKVSLPAFEIEYL